MRQNIVSTYLDLMRILWRNCYAVVKLLTPFYNGETNDSPHSSCIFSSQSSKDPYIIWKQEVKNHIFVTHIYEVSNFDLH